MKINSINSYGFNSVSVQNLRSKNEDKINSNPISFRAILNPYKKIIHIIPDGVGLTEDLINNPLIGNMPFLSKLMRNENGVTLFRKVEASGKFIGLDKGEPGNSESGHSVMGSGRNIEQAMVRLDKMLEDGTFFKNPEFLKAMEHAKKNNSTLHILGSIGYSHTHSKMEHIEALIKMAKENGVKDLAVHTFLNGAGPSSSTSIEYVNQLNNILADNGYPQIASVIGREIALNKSGNEAKVEDGFRMLIQGDNAQKVASIEEGVQSHLQNNVEGVNMPATIVEGSPRISDNDAVIFANYRTDRPKALTAALAYKDSHFKFLENYNRPQNLYFVTMTEYDPKFKLPFALPSVVYNGTVKEELLNNDYFITCCAQKEKWAHVHSFYNGEKDINHDNMQDIKLPGCTDSEKLTESLNEQVNTLIKVMNTRNTGKEFIVTNLANGDIAGHKGNKKVSEEAARAVDSALERLVEAAIKNDYAVVINADHGNIENLLDTKHTANPVPFAVVLPHHGKEIQSGLITLRSDVDAALRDIAPTILDIAGLPNGKLMTGKSLLVEA